LIHGPIGGTQARKDSWRAICDAKKEEGTLRSIGISTFGVKHIKEILEEGGEVPAVHQVREDILAVLIVNNMVTRLTFTLS
jgi:diketogulonate reductase-like aldo/keto reductase